MGLRAIATAALYGSKKTVSVVQTTKEEKMPEAEPIEEGEITDETPYYKKKLSGSSTSINAIAKELGNVKQANQSAEKARLWKECSSLKEANGRYTCLKFMSKCAREKCPKKYID